uniref:Uncharacterized protein n=1 Tax=Manihot esculenta TaxID=3983 RepID=A0A2C9VWW5_MANES
MCVFPAFDEDMEQGVFLPLLMFALPHSCVNIVIILDFLYQVSLDPVEPSPSLSLPFFLLV